MKAHRWKSSCAIVIALILVGSQTLRAKDNSIPGVLPTGQEAERENGSLGQIGQDLLRNLMGDVPIPKATAQRFSVLFERHKAELESLANAHQNLIWETLQVVIELLPSLKTVDTHDAQLRVSRRTYDKVASLMERCEQLATPEFAHDLRKAKTLVESRLKEGDQESLIIDLRE